VSLTRHDSFDARHAENTPFDTGMPVSTSHAVDNPAAAFQQFITSLVLTPGGHAGGKNARAARAISRMLSMRSARGQL
jgi:hypothetical protein